MKSMLINNKKYIFVIIYIVVFIICLVLININKIVDVKNKEKVSNMNKKIINQNIQNDTSVYNYAKVYISENKNKITTYFDNRVGIVKGNDIFIGTNVKEIENGYYDICISLKENKLEVSVVKLWKNINSKFLYDEYYLKELSRCILHICKKDYTEEQIQKFEEYLINSYLSSKKENPLINNIKIDNIQIFGEVKSGILVISIY